MFKVHRSYTLSTGVKNNTIAVFNWSNGQNIIVLYHETMVVQKKGDEIYIDNGGYDTISTRAVINRALQLMLFMEDTYLLRKRGKTYVSRNGVVSEFVGEYTFKPSTK